MAAARGPDRQAGLRRRVRDRRRRPWSRSATTARSTRAASIQAHSQEDGAFKSDRIAIGARCTVGTRALVHYGTTMGDGAELAPDSFLMKGEEVPPDAALAGQPGDRRESVVRGVAAIPRWTLEPVPGVAEHEATVPDGVVAELRGLAVELGVPLSAVLLGAHAKVLAVLTGEPVVTTGYVAPEAGEPLPCRLTTDHGSWRDLLLEAARRRVGAARPSELPVRDRVRSGGRRRASRTAPCSRSRCCGASDGLALRLRYRTDVLDADAAARIAGYHLTALALIAADPDADPGRQSLLGDEELGFQLEELAGPHRELPDRRFHELFEARVREHPEAVAAIQGERRWTYAELNAHANRVGRALLARGLGREGVVAVVTERNLDWMAAVLAILKAGGVYLPIEPQFPADRIAATLNRAGCTIVLTEPGSTATLDRALESTNGVQALSIHAAYEEDHADDDLGVAVDARAARLHLLHLGLDRGAQGRDVRARGVPQPPLRQDRRPGDRRGRRGRPDRAAVLRHLAVAAGLGAPRRRPDPAGRAGRDPGRRALRGQDRGRAGRGSPGRALVPRRRPLPPGASARASFRTCAACRSRARR